MTLTPTRTLASGSVAHIEPNGDVSLIEPADAVFEDIEPTSDDWLFIDEGPHPSDYEAA